MDERTEVLCAGGCGKAVWAEQGGCSSFCCEVELILDRLYCVDCAKIFYDTEAAQGICNDCHKANVPLVEYNFYDSPATHCCEDCCSIRDSIVYESLDNAGPPSCPYCGRENTGSCEYWHGSSICPDCGGYP